MHTVSNAYECGIGEHKDGTLCDGTTTYDTQSCYYDNDCGADGANPITGHFCDCGSVPCAVGKYCYTVPHNIFVCRDAPQWIVCDTTIARYTDPVSVQCRCGQTLQPYCDSGDYCYDNSCHNNPKYTNCVQSYTTRASNGGVDGCRCSPSSMSNDCKPVRDPFTYVTTYPYCYDDSCETHPPAPQCTEYKKFWPVTSICKCGSGPSCATGKYCYDNSCHELPACSPSYETQPSTKVNGCTCGSVSEVCAVGKYCYGNSCHEIPKCESATEDIESLKECTCGSGSEVCAIGKYCYDNSCHDVGKSVCSDSSTDAITVECKCGLPSVPLNPYYPYYDLVPAECGIGKYCYDDSCQDVGVCSAASRTDAITVKCKCGTPYGLVPPECGIGKYCYDDSCQDVPTLPICSNSADPIVGSSCECGYSTECGIGQYCYDHNGDGSLRCEVVQPCVAGEHITWANSALILFNSGPSRECAACPDGKFSNKPNQLECTGHSFCSPQQYIQTHPTPTADIACLPLRDCVPGEYVTVAPELDDTAAPELDSMFTWKTNRQCADCPSGKFSNDTNQDQCEDFTLCVAGEVPDPNAQGPGFSLNSDNYGHRVEVSQDQWCIQSRGYDGGHIDLGQYQGSGVCEITPLAPMTLNTVSFDIGPTTDPQCPESPTGTQFGKRNEMILIQVGGASDSTIQRFCIQGFGPSNLDVDTSSLITVKPKLYWAVAGYTGFKICGERPPLYPSSATADRTCQPVKQCVVGQYEVRAPSVGVDRQCADCPAGKYTDDINQGSCKLIPCAPGKYVSRTTWSEKHSNKALSGCSSSGCGSFSSLISAKQACTAASSCGGVTQEEASVESCFTVTIGSSESNSKSVNSNEASGFSCPSIVNKNNWLTFDTYGDTFSITVSGSQVQATRTDSDDSWGMNLQISCCHPGSAEKYTLRSSTSLSSSSQAENSWVLQDVDPRVCADCPSGTYTNDTEQAHCTPHTVCSGEKTDFKANGQQPFTITGSGCELGDSTDSGDEKCFLTTYSTSYPRHVDKGGCIVTFEKEVTLTAVKWDLPSYSQCSNDHVLLNGNKYCGSGQNDVPPTGPYPSGTVLQWNLNAAYSDTMYGGFKICAGAEYSPTPPTTADRRCADWPYNDCAPGKYVTGGGVGRVDRQCADCPAGKYADDINQDSCTDWTDCQNGQYEKHQGNATDDRECINWSAECTGNNEYQSIAPTSHNDRVCSMYPKCTDNDGIDCATVGAVDFEGVGHYLITTTRVDVSDRYCLSPDCGLANNGVYDTNELVNCCKTHSCSTLKTWYEHSGNSCEATTCSQRCKAVRSAYQAKCLATCTAAILCAENHHVSSGSCQACPSGIRAAGDDPSGTDTTCDLPPCAENHHVSGGECVACSTGFGHPAGANPDGPDTSCNVCAENFYVYAGSCVACSTGTTNAAGDDPSGADTTCDLPPCAENHHVSGGECVACSTGFGHPAGANPDGPDTSCNVCAENYYGNGAGSCIACPTGYGHPAGANPSGDFVFCTLCTENYYASTGSCLACGTGKTREAGSVLSEGQTTCA